MADERFGTCTLDAVIPVDNTLIMLNGDDTHMTVFNPSDELFELVKALALGEGLYVWKPEEE